MVTTHHYPPEVMQLLIDVIPVLFKGKRDVITFFRGAGVGVEYTSDLSAQLDKDKDSIGKYHIVRTVLSRLNDKGQATLFQTREIIKRVTEFEEFSTCWEKDQHKAKALVGDLKKIVNVKDSFTRMNIERDKEVIKNAKEKDLAVAKVKKEQEAIDAVKRDLFALFKMTNARERGLALEGVLNRLFTCEGILIREGFKVSMQDSGIVYEQIDGAIEISGHFYIVEMKWWNHALGQSDVSSTIVKASRRGNCRALIISYNGFTDPAIQSCRDTAKMALSVLCNLQEFIDVLERKESILPMLKKKIENAVLDNLPYSKVS